MKQPAGPNGSPDGSKPPRRRQDAENPEEQHSVLQVPMARTQVPFFNLIVYGFIYLTVIGGILLMLPFASADGDFTSPIDAFFTAASAVSSTGLVVVDTSDAWSRSGDIIIMALIQIGGVGYMTMSAFLLLLVRGRVNLGDDMVAETLGIASPRNFLIFAGWVLGITLLIEAIGVIVILSRFGASFPDKGLFESIFYGIAAFNNAGFDLEGGLQGISAFQADNILLGAISGLVIVGGLGVPMLTVLLTRRSWKNWTLDSKMAIASTFALLLIGALAIGSVETAASIAHGNDSLGNEAVNSFFLSASARTAGFSTVDIGGLTIQTLIVIIALMFIGGVSGSTAGGIKVNTFTTVFCTAFSYLRGYQRVHAFGRVIPETQVHRAIAIIFLGVMLVFFLTLIMSFLEPFDFIPIVFETVSAFSTTGFSTGITPDLSTGGKTVLIFAMFVGRLGPLTVALAMTRHKWAAREVETVEEPVRIG